MHNACDLHPVHTVLARGNGVVHGMQLFALYRSKIRVFETFFCQREQPSYVKHVLGSVYVFFTQSGDWVCGLGVGGVSNGGGMRRIAMVQSCLCNLTQ